MSEASEWHYAPSGASVLLNARQIRAYRGPSLVLFLGISTAGSLAHNTFPAWSEIFCPGAVSGLGLQLPRPADHPATK